MALGASATALADDPLGLYVGAGAGQSTLRQDEVQINAHATGWKVMAGWRPISWFGAEVEYADFGSKNVTNNEGSISTHISTDAHASSVFALLYLPVPEPWLDLYAKAGPARVQQNATSTCSGCPTAPGVPNPMISDSSRTGVAWGAGLQFKWGLPALRVEYERYAGAQGNDELLTAAVTANF
jgi:opacity protein-like surface antigen